MGCGDFILITPLFSEWLARRGQLYRVARPSSQQNRPYVRGKGAGYLLELFLNGRKLKGRYTIQYTPMGGRRVWLIGKPKDQTPYAEANKLDDVVNELKGKGQRYLVWAKPGEKPELMDAARAEQLTCPKCGEALRPEATRLAKLGDDFHDVFRCPGCKHIFSPNNLG